MFTPKPMINAQKLLVRIQQLEEATQTLGQQNLELKDQNQQLEAQIMATTTTERTSKAKVNPPEPFRGERGKGKEFDTDKDKVMMAASYLQESAFDWFDAYLRNYYERNDIEKDDDMAKVIDNYNLFINTLKTTFGEVEEHNAATQQLYHIRQKTSP
ncbi:hypothetical protein LOZ66_006889 [Ophidiomyces ophidiicola]|nr:hypothetical protein LOZ66_006889 [Ophidiomyces ophidiicola]